MLADQSVLRICVKTTDDCINVVVFSPASPTVHGSIWRQSIAKMLTNFNSYLTFNTQHFFAYNCQFPKTTRLTNKGTIHVE